MLAYLKTKILVVFLYKYKFKVSSKATVRVFHLC